MSAFLEQRQQIIAENIPKLIELLTKFQKDDENYKLCEQFAFNTIKNHRFLSTNVHEVKRNIEGMRENLRINNYKKYGDYLQRLTDGIVEHPLCKNHCEVDVGWAVIDFLFNLSYNPVGALRTNKEKISLETAVDICNDTNKEREYWSKVLKEDFVPVNQKQSRDDVLSDLSDWSDTDDEDLSSKSCEIVDNKLMIEKSFSKTTCIVPGVNLEPPKKIDNFSIFEGGDSKNWLIQNCQNSWWLNTNSNCNVNSGFDLANFAHLWNKYVSESSNNFIKLEQISTETEYCLMREIIWMLYTPESCKFFIMDENGDIGVRKNVTIPSLTVNGLQIFLQNSFIPAMKQQQTLQKFLQNVYNYDNIIPPKTYETYAASLKEILEPFYEKILQIEENIKSQSPGMILTIMQMSRELDKNFRYLEKVYNIHTAAVLDFTKYLPHISSAHLLASLLFYFQNAACIETANISITLFISAIQPFCNIIDTWWAEGRLDDWCNEFVIEKINDQTEEISIRPYEKSKEKAFFVPKNVSKVILDNSFLKLLISHSIEAGCTLNLLYKIDKIGKLRNASSFEESLYDEFIEDIISSVTQFEIVNKVNSRKQSNEIINRIVSQTENDISICDENINDVLCFRPDELLKISSTGKDLENPPEINDLNEFKTEKCSTSKFLDECASMSDEFLVMAFTCNLNITSKENDSEIKEADEIKNCRFMKVLKKFNKTSNIILPLEEIILRSIRKILAYRISFTNNFVMEMYRDEFEIGKHLKNIRRVLLLEAGDLLQIFYSKIFYDIENGKNWANSYALTVQLDDIITSKCSDVSSMFKVEINSLYKCQTSKVVEAVDQISIYYDVREELKNIITSQSIEEYNKVFRFLLKIKWGLWTLENLSFPKSHKNRPPYAAFQLIDLNMRQLEQLRLWMMYCLQCVHFHLMTHVLQSMGQQLDDKIESCHNLAELQSLHKSYLSTICEHCFLIDEYQSIKVGVEQLLNLTFVIKEEWKKCVREIDNDFILADDTDTSIDDDSLDQKFFANSSEIKIIENTYIRCHEFLARSLNNEVYMNQKGFMSGLSAAFNTSMPC